ncbi:MAG TPA: YeeE/YedE thiosulfate transporter family protein [Leptolyngbyaceae cyanobacterium]
MVFRADGYKGTPNRKENDILSQLNSLNLKSQIFSFIYGPWSLLTGAVALAVLNWLTLIVSGQPWRITWGFAVWAAQIATWLGWNPTSSTFWSNGAAKQALSQGVLADVSSLMNIGIVLGGTLAAALAGKLVLKFQLSTRAIVTTLLGGLIMGYGAFLGFGCNVSAFFGGIASTSVHGWVWIFCALVGTAIGLYLRSLISYFAAKLGDA